MIPATRLFLVLSAIVLLALGATFTFVPHTLYHLDETTLSGTGMLLSDLRSGGANFLALAGFSLFAAWKDTYLKTALVLSVLTYLGYGAGRFIGLAMDGNADAMFAVVTGLEWGLGLIAAGLLAQILRKPTPGGLATA